MTERKCEYCGKLYIPKCINAKYCSNDCKMAVQKIQKKKSGSRTSVKKKKKVTLNDINAEARKLGMTYGEYVAKMGL